MWWKALAIPVLKFFIAFEQGPPGFHSALGPTDYATGFGKILSCSRERWCDLWNPSQEKAAQLPDALGLSPGFHPSCFQSPGLNNSSM